MDKTELENLIRSAVSLAEHWQNRANQLLTPEEKELQNQIRRLLTHPLDKVILVKIIDQSFRSHDYGRVADQISNIFKQYRVPEFFSGLDKLLTQVFLGVGRYFPDLSVPKIIEKMRHDSHRVIIPGERGALSAYLEKRKAQGVRININHLGEAVLGEQEARHRLDAYIRDLEDPAIECISVKISTLYSQIHPLAFESSVNILKERLTLLYQTAGKHTFVRSDGSRVPKFVYLDMESYRDVEITLAAFMQTLAQSEFKDFSAGIALQAYLPDSHVLQQQLTDWARQRVRAGGAPIQLRIVKGANLEMEKIESALWNWPLVTYDSKREVDANYKRMLFYGLAPENICAVNLGVASHNLFDLAFAYQLARLREAAAYIHFEMLEGMADHVARALSETVADMLLYAPVANRREFINAIAYLIRRLDENTGVDNFLRHAPGLKTGTREWERLKQGFEESCRHIFTASAGPNRRQNRAAEDFSRKIGSFHKQEFDNEPDTDWSLSANRRWAEGIRSDWKKSPKDPPLEIPLVVGNKEIFSGRKTGDCFDPSRYPEKVCVARYARASAQDIERAVRVAAADPDNWRAKTPRQRHRILSRVAMELRKSRGDLIGAAAANTGKTFAEADPEVSEAIDFAEYYPFSVDLYPRMDGISSSGKGVGLVISPWNFPISIPCGGIIAALSAGNTVVFKPSSDAVLVAWQLCRSFWNSGISKNVLQFIPCSGSSEGDLLTAHPDIDFVILTGSTATGLRIAEQRPGLYLAAETGGKNATIVTAAADRDQAIKNVVHSAFSNSGQKCSATSLLILEKEVFEDGHFKKQLIDAVQSLNVGSAWDFKNKLSALIRPPAGDLLRALTELEPGESWALEPKNIDHNPHLWTAGIKWNVQPGSYTHMTEFFGPVLGVMCADNLDHAIELANQTGYGLTAGLESLDEREQALWKANLKAGNLYINRQTTGAIVLRQPFGGMGKSALGAGFKAGGPNYIFQFMNFKDEKLPRVGALKKDSALLRLADEWKRKLSAGQFHDMQTDILRTLRAIKSYLFHYEQEFSLEKDYFHLRGQHNILRYLPFERVIVRLHADDSLFDTLARIAAARISGASVSVSIPPQLDNATTAFLNGPEGAKLLGNIEPRHETEAELIKKMETAPRIRYGAPDRAPQAVLAEAARKGLYISRTRVLMEGRIELLQYFREQSICDNYHRYGNLGEHALLQP